AAITPKSELLYVTGCIWTFCTASVMLLSAIMMRHFLLKGASNMHMKVSCSDRFGKAVPCLIEVCLALPKSNEIPLEPAGVPLKELDHAD
ncbi:MAG: hypothetical protein WCR06_05170, partial [bacterium]